MRMGLHRGTRTLTSALALAAGGCLIAGSLSAAPLERLSSDFQNTASGANEVSTSTAPGPNPLTGGFLAYSKTLTVPDTLDVLYITFSAQGDSHNGSALLMNASVAEGDGLHPTEALCQPLRGQTGEGGGGGPTPAGWYTLSHLPQSTTGTNCNNGGGGTADCHDNTIYFSCCARLVTAPPTTATVRIRLANIPGVTGGTAGTSFYERATINIDAVSDPGTPLHPGTQCMPHGVP
jgi:hypothetical protein